MLSFLENIFTVVLTGGHPAIIVILLLVMGFLILDRIRLIKEVTKKDEKLEKIIDDYYRGNISLADALRGLKTVLYEIKAKLPEK